MFELFLKELVIDFVVFEVVDFLFDELYGLLGKFETVSLVELLEVFFEFLFDVVEMPVYFILAVVVLLTVGSSEFATIDSNSFSAYEACFLQESCVEFEAVFESFWIVFTEVCDGMLVGGKSIDEPSDFNVSKAFFFKSSTASDAIKVPVKVDFEKYLWVKRRSAVEIGIVFFGLFFIGWFGNKPQKYQVKLINKGIDYSDGVVFGNGIFQRGEGHLKPVYS